LGLGGFLEGVALNRHGTAPLMGLVVGVVGLVAGLIVGLIVGLWKDP